MKSHNTKLRQNILAQSLACAFGAIFASSALASVPVVSSYSPADNSLTVAPSANLVLNFNQIVQANTGKNIVIRKASDNSVVETIAASDAGKVTISSSKETVSSSKVTINPASDLALGTDYYVQIEAGAFKDTATPASDYVGIGDTTTWNFKTVAGGIPINYYPANGATGFQETSNLSLSFGEAVTPVAGKSIRIYRANASLVETIAVNDATKVRNSGSTVEFNPAANLSSGGYYVNIDAGAFIGNVSGASFSGIADATTWAFSTIPDITAPTAHFPVDATGVLTYDNLNLYFDEVVTAVAGKNIVIRSSADNSVVETIVAADASKVTVSTSTITSVNINPTNDFAFSTAYYVQIDPGAFQDTASTPNPYAGINGTTTWRFTTVAGATPISSYPSNHATDFKDNANLVLTFSEPMVAVAGRNIVIYRADGTLVETIAANDSAKVTAGQSISINPTANLSPGSYYVRIDNGAFFGSKSGLPFVGITDATTWAFSTVADVTAPTATFSPADNAVGVSPTSNLNLYFDEFVTAVPGKSIVIKKTADNSVVETIAANDTAKVTISSSKSTSVTINPASNLAFDTGYYVQIDAGAFADKASTPNPYAGIADTSTWNFTTAHDAVAPVFTVAPYVVGAPTYNSATFSTTIDEPGRIYYVVVAAAAAAPTAAQVKAGVSYGGVAVLSHFDTVMPGHTATNLPASFPSASTSYAVYFVAEDNAGNLQAAPFVVNVSTAAPPPTIGFNPISLTFGNQSVGTTSGAQNVTLTNAGGSALAISSITSTNNAFAVTNNCGTSVASGASCSLGATFSPVTATTLLASIVVASNAPGSPHSVSLSGTGISPSSPVCSLTATPASVPRNGTSVLTASCTNTPTSYTWIGGSCAGNTSATCTVTPAATTSYTVTGTNASGSGSAYATVTVMGFDIAPLMLLLLD